MSHSSKIWQEDPEEGEIMANYVQARRNSQNPTSFKTVHSAISAVVHDSKPKKLEKRESFTETMPVFSKQKVRKDSTAMFGLKSNSFKEKMRNLKNRHHVEVYNKKKDERMVRDEEDKLVKTRKEVIERRRSSSAELEERQRVILEKLKNEKLGKK